MGIKMNLIEKIYTLLVSKEVRIWHYICKKEKPFEYQFQDESFQFETMEEMVTEAYKRIDPLLKPLEQPLEQPTSSLIKCWQEDEDGCYY